MELFEQASIGDNKPTHLMSRMLVLLDPGETPTGLFMWSFLKKLPAQLRGAVALHDCTTLRQLAVAADSW